MVVERRESQETGGLEPFVGKGRINGQIGRKRGSGKTFVSYRGLQSSQSIDLVHFNAKDSSHFRAWFGFHSSANGIRPTLVSFSP